jgi:hypothetical protein
LLARRLRKFGGKLADNSLWMMMPQGVEQISESALGELDKLEVQIHRFEVPEETLDFWFGGKVYAAAAAEDLATDQTDILIWMDSDTVVLGEPSEFLLDADTSLGYCPVMLKNISLLYDEPLNAFWEFIYARCGTPEEHIFPMLTTVDEVRIRPQFNAGIMSVRPKKHLLQSWRDNFERLYLRAELTPFYEQHVLYKIFVHQSILSATLLASLHKDEMRDMGARVNFPMFLAVKPEIARNAVTLRYDEFKFFETSDWGEKAILDENLKAWLREQI